MAPCDVRLTEGLTPPFDVCRMSDIGRATQGERERYLRPSSLDSLDWSSWHERLRKGLRWIRFVLRLFWVPRGGSRLSLPHGLVAASGPFFRFYGKDGSFRPSRRSTGTDWDVA